LLLSADTNNYFKHTVTQPLLFTVGGPLRLSAASVDEFRGTDSYLVRTAYARRIASLPVAYGDGLYAAFAYEAAEIWSPQQRAILHQDGLFTLIGVLPIGSLTLGGSMGDEGHRKVFVTFGRIF
jgi:NTE family protein